MDTVNQILIEIERREQEYEGAVSSSEKRLLEKELRELYHALHRPTRKKVQEM